MAAEINNALPKGSKLHGPDVTYRIEKTLGAGGFGITYLAVGEVMVGNVPAEVKFAIKEHFPTASCKRDGAAVIVDDDKLDTYKSSLADFIAEAKKLHALGTQNENIVKVNEVFEENGTAYYVMQYINGESLSSYVKSKGKLSYTEAVGILSPILDAVDFLHSSRINHLDIKPENIMLHRGVDGISPILIDFGLSVHFKKSGGKTSPKGVEGVSEGYSPLEQYAGIKEFNPATDIYALAATLLYTLTGKTPKSAAEIRLSEVRTALADVASPDAIEGICKALNKSDEDRTSSVKTLKSDIGLLDGGGSVTQIISRNEKKKDKSFLSIIIGVSAVAVIAVIAVILLMNREPQPAPVQDSELVAADTLSVDSSAPENQVAEAATPATAQPETPATEPAKQETSIPGAAAQKPQAGQNAGSDSRQEPKAEVREGTLSLGYGTWRGGIRNGKPDGKGRLTFSSTHRVDRSSSQEANPGDYFVATYDNGSLISGKLYDSSGNLIKTIIP